MKKNIDILFISIIILSIIAVSIFWLVNKDAMHQDNINIIEPAKTQEVKEDNTIKKIPENIVKQNSLTNFIFDIIADPHMDEQSDSEIFKQTLNNIVQDNPSFVVDLGDTFMIDKLKDPSEENIRARYVLIKEYYDLLGNIPLYFTVGNHEGEAGWDKINARDYRLEYFPEQDYGKNYYSFEENNALFIILDPFTYTMKKPKDDGWLWTLGKEQYEWLKETLELSNAEYKFVFIHHLVGSGSGDGRGGVEFANLYEWGGNNVDGSYGFDSKRPGWGKPIHQLLLENNVNAVFKGHDHFYAKQEMDGIIYLTLPQPSHPGNKVNTAEEYGYYEGEIIGGSGHIRVTVNDEVTIEFVRYEGNIVNKISIS